MARQTFSAISLAVALVAFGNASASRAASHSEAPLISEDPAADVVIPTTPNAANNTGPREHEAIEEWRKRRYQQPRPPQVRPPIRRNPPSSFN